ncbi:perlucin-like [Crassostrea virginica]|uniref:Galactose-specific lectin nattectin-like n=1 Tax=Crassostrea virginica TaxID=6565 RepID=A0A8B8AWT6_CRAVI|nr:galactose-specific lectin nattectin-like [Crassostrea virginica]
MVFLFITLAGILCSSSVVQSLCPDNWVSHGGECYAFVTNIKSTWINAGAYCRNAEAKLVEVDSVDEENFLRSHLISSQISESFWIGGTDTVKEGKWVWMSSQDPLDYKDWAHNEPNNGIEGGCMTMANHLRFHWNDDLCNSQINFICEKTVNQIVGDLIG